MIFAYSTDDRCLMVFPDEARAYSYCEIYDVRDGGWLFFDDAGRPLAAVVTPLPAGRLARFFAGPGDYALESQTDVPESAMLLNLLPQVVSVDSQPLRRAGSAPMPALDSIEAIRRYLESRTPIRST